MKDLLQDKITDNRYIPVNQWINYHSWPTEGGLRYLILHRKRNGFEKVIKRVGKRVLIDENAFMVWMSEQEEG